jgi:FkbM family methyltransferase
MKTINYNGNKLYIGTLADDNDRVYEHMQVPTGEKLKDDWGQRFNCQVIEIENFINLTKDKKVFIDVGSQFGNFSFSFLGNDVNKTAYAFDGGTNPYLVTQQVKIINKLHNFNCFNFLIGNQNGPIQCYSEALQSLAIPGSDVKQMFTIDTLCAMFNIEPDVIKIDIEGSELHALFGAIDTINLYKPMIFIEVHPKFLQMYNSSIEQIASFVEKINYDVFDMQGNKVINYLDILRSESTESNRTVWKSKN